MAKLVPGVNDLATLDPALAAELVDPSLARTVTRSSHKSVAWFCVGTDDRPHPRHEWSAPVANRSNGSGCPACSGKVVIVGWNDLGTLNPELAAELVDPSLARTFTPRSGKSVAWFCVGTADLPHPRREWSTKVSNRSAGVGCGACSGRAVLAGWNDLGTLNPELAAELIDPSLARTLTRNSNKSVAWFCVGTNDLPHPRREWTTTVNNRSRGTGCAACAGKAVIVGWNDLATDNPELAAELVDPSLARTLTRSSNKPVQWFCVGTNDLPHPRREWSAAVGSRANGNGCAACSGHVVIVGWNDLATVEPGLAAELADPSLARTLTRSSKKSVAWFCVGTNDLPHPRREWSAAVGSRSNGTGCAACSGQAVIVGWNDLATVEPDLAAELVDPSLARTLTRSSKKSVAWFCVGTNDLPHPRREWSAAVGSRSKGHRCAVCASSGFDPSKAGWLYLMRHDGWDMQQIGITNVVDQRIGRHERSGWQLVDIRKFDDGELCAANERAGLTALRLRGARLGNPIDALAVRFDGYTEAWPTHTLEITDLQQLLEWIRDDEFDIRPLAGGDS
jgi:hypothetical protein